MYIYMYICIYIHLFIYVYITTRMDVYMYMTHVYATSGTLSVNVRNTVRYFPTELIILCTRWHHDDSSINTW